MSVLSNSAYFDHTVEDISPFKNIVSIKGALRIQGSKLKNTNSFEKLRTVGAIDFRGNSELTQIQFENLETIDNGIAIANNNSLAIIEMSNLVELDSSGIDIVFNDKLESCLFQKLEKYTGLNISFNPKFTLLDMLNPIPESAAYNVKVEFDKMLTNEYLFSNTQNWYGIKIKANLLDWENLKWLLNSPQAVLHDFSIEAPIEIEEMCDLKVYLEKSIHPSNFKITWKGMSFYGDEIVQICN